MKKLLFLLLALPFVVQAEQRTEALYGVATTIVFEQYDTDGTLDINEVDGVTEVTVHCDEDAGTTATNDFVDEGTYYSIALTAGELECARTVLRVAASLEHIIIVETTGHPNAQHVWGGSPVKGSGITDATGTTTETDLTGGSAVDDTYNDYVLNVYDVSVGQWYEAVITDYVGSTNKAAHTEILNIPVSGDAWTVLPEKGIILPTLNGVVDANITTVANNAMTNAGLADGFLGASEVATDAADKIGAAGWGIDATGEQTQGTFGQAIGDPVADATTIYQAVATDATGDNVAVDVVALKAETVLIVADTGELQTDDYPTTIAAIKTETALIVADTNELQVDDIPTLIAALPTAIEIWAIQCEDQGTPVTCREAMSILLDEAAGTAVYTSGTRTWAVSDPSGTETRLTIVYGTDLDGDRDTSTLAPMTP